MDEKYGFKLMILTNSTIIDMEEKRNLIKKLSNLNIIQYSKFYYTSVKNYYDLQTPTVEVI